MFVSVQLLSGLLPALSTKISYDEGTPRLLDVPSIVCDDATICGEEDDTLGRPDRRSLA